MIEMVVLNAAAGDFTAEFDVDDKAASSQLAEMVTDMLRKGYALFLEDGGKTHRVTGYDPTKGEFEVRAIQHRKGTVKIRVASDVVPSAEPLLSPGSGKPFPKAEPAAAPKRGRPKQRVTSVAPTAGG